MCRCASVEEAADACDEARDHSHGDGDRGGGSSQSSEAHGRGSHSDRSGGHTTQQGSRTDGNRGTAHADFAGASQDAGEFFACQAGIDAFLGDHGFSF